MTGARTFPILLSWDERRKNPDVKRNLPWDFIAPHEKQAQANHYQTLERLAQRGGLSWMEMLAVLMDLDFRRINPKANHEAHVLKLLKEWEAVHVEAE